MTEETLNIIMRILFCLLAYLIGSIPFGFFIGKLKGVDVRKEGSKNIGATNVGRVLGKKYSYITYVLDMLKGFIFVFLFNYKILPTSWCVLNPLLYGFLANLGHCFPIYLKFKGGKSVSCGSGAVGGYDPFLFLIMVIIFFIVKKLGKLVSLASLVSAFCGFVIGFISVIVMKQFSFINIYEYEFVFGGPHDLWFLIFTFLIALLIYIRHIPNIKRLLKGEEKPANY